LHAQTAVISCGKNNVYGHPSQEVLDNLGRVGAQAFRTDLDGNVMITVSKDGRYVVQCEKKTGK
jgi:competence protein ComEC